MRKIFFYVSIFLLVLTSSCEVDLSGNNPCAGDGEVQCQNRSTTGKTYSVVWDNVRVATLSPGTESEAMTVTAGEHSLRFIIANTNTNACAASNPSIPECQMRTFFCSN